MTIQAIVFDIGGVLEITPRFGITDSWEEKLGLGKGEIDRRCMEIWKAGSIGTISEQDVHQGIGETLGWDEPRVNAFMADIWREYLGTLNGELAGYFRTLHQGPYQTAIISNSFVGAREREEELYRFSEMTEFIVYSHEAGVSKPNPRIYELACERLGVRPEEMIFLDDAEACVTGAAELGIQAIRFEDNAQAIAAIDAVLWQHGPSRRF